MSRPFSAYHANDWTTLPIAARAGAVTGGKILFDAHEYAPLEYEENREWLLTVAPSVHHALKKYARYVSASVTVSPDIASRYSAEYALRPEVVRNAPERVALTPHAVDAAAIRLVHHGIAARGRRLENMIFAVGLAQERYRFTSCWYREIVTTRRS